VAGFSERIRLIIDVSTGNARGPLRQLSSDLKQADGAFAKTKVAAGGLFDSLKAAAVPAALAAGTALAAFAAKAIGDFQNVALSAGKLRDSLGVTAEEASQLQEVAGDLGIGVGVLESSMGKMNRAAATTPAAFDEIGAAIARNADGTVNVTETFLNAIEALRRIPDATQRAAAAQKIFGRGWQQMSELIMMGAKGVRQAMDEVEAGKIVGDDQIDQAKELRDNLDQLKGVVESLSVALGGELAGGINDALSGLRTLGEQLERINDIPGLGGARAEELNQLRSALEGGALSGLAELNKLLGADITGTVSAELVAATRATAGLADATANAESIHRANFAALEDEGAATRAVASETRNAEAVHREHFAALEDSSDALVTAAEAAQNEADALNEAAEAAQASADAHAAEADALFATIDARRAAADAQFAANDATRDFGEAVASYLTMVAEGEATMSELAAAQEEVVSSASNAADAAQRLAEEQAASNGAALSAAQAGDIWRDSMIEQAGAAGALSGPILDYVATVEGIPPEKLTEIKAMVAAGDLEGAKAALDAASETRTAQIAAEAQVAAATADLNAVASAQRVADIVAQAWTTAADEGLDGVAAQNRVAEILGQALTGEANADLNALGPYTPSVIGRYSGTTGIPSSITIPVRLQASGAVAGVRANGMIMNAEGGTAGSRSVAGETGQLEFTGPGAVAAPTFIRPATPITGVRESADLISSLTAAVDRLAATRNGGAAINEDALARAIGREVRAAIGYRR
jgi:hypothetical protein